MGIPSKMLGQHRGEGGFTRSDIACDSYENLLIGHGPRPPLG
jgi:hypothetical protein